MRTFLVFTIGLVVAGCGFPGFGSGAPDPAPADMGARDLSQPRDLERPLGDGPKRGLITATEGSSSNAAGVDGGALDARVSARFWTTLATTQSGCTTETSGACTLYRCDADAGIGGSLTSPWSAGAVTVVAPGSGLRPLTLLPDNRGRYQDLTAGPSSLWNPRAPGQVLAFMAEGDRVPAFSESLPAPTQVTLTGPAPASPIARSGDLALAWSGGTVGELTLTLSWLQCRFDAAAGRGTVPASLLGELPAGTAWLIAFVASEKTITAGEWSVTLQAHVPALIADGTLAVFQTTLE